MASTSAPTSPDEWLDQFRDVNGRLPAPVKASKVVIANLHPGTVSAAFTHSIQASTFHDQANHQRFFDRGRFGFIAVQSGAGRLERGRNEAVANFLDSPLHAGSDLLMFIDSDMGWDPDAIERIAAAIDDDPEERPVVGGLCFGDKVVAKGGQASMVTHSFPTLYTWDAGPPEPGFDVMYDLPDQPGLVEVAATGAAFLMIHRTALQAIRENEGDVWFNPVSVEVEGRREPKIFGEDMSFCIRARNLGKRVWVHTGAETSHMKSVWINRDYYDMLRRPTHSGCTVVIPVKDELEMTRSVLGELQSIGGFDDIVVIDNGSDAETAEWLAGQTAATVLDGSGMGIHEMWNLGTEWALDRHPRGDVIYLNNDLRIGPGFCQRLIAGLHSDPQLLAVSANYDGREGRTVIPVHGICANRYDGTGGLAGFAFAVRNDFLTRDGGFRFPETLKWWYGDNHLCLSIEQAGGWYGIVPNAMVEHLDGGSQTDRPDGFDDITVADREEFLRLWPGITLTPAGVGADTLAGVGSA